MEKRNEYEYYDQGWNAYIDGEKFDITATRDWKDGWRDARDAPLEDLIKI